MSINRRRLIQSATAATGLAAIGMSHPAGGIAQETPPLVIGSLEEPGSLSALVDLPHHFPEHVPQTLLFDSLTQFLPDSTVGPKLATSWEISDDALTYTFALDPNATFHDGQPVTAGDVVFTFQSCLDPESNASSEGLENVTTVEALDPQTVRVTLSRVSPAFLAQGGARGIAPKHLLEGKDLATDPFNQEPVGCGPYRLVSYAPGEVIVLEAVAGHFRGTPSIPRVEFRIVTDQNVILTQLLSGELTYGLVAPRDLAVLEGSETIQIAEVPTPRFFDITPNFARSWWQDVAVRNAILGAIDRAGIASAILLDHGTVIDANVAPASWAFITDGVTTHPYDPDAAAASLEAAGWIPSDGGTRVKESESLAFGVMLYAYDQTLQQALLVAQQNLAGIGVAMSLEPVDPGVFSERRGSGDFDALARVWNPVYDPDQASLLQTGNFSGYSNPLVDALCDDTLARIDQDARKPVYAELQRVVSEDLPRLFLYSENELHAIAGSVQGLAAHPVNVFWNLPAWTMAAS